MSKFELKGSEILFHRFYAIIIYLVNQRVFNCKESAVAIVSFGGGISPKGFEASKGVLELRVRAIFFG